jgi:hypothetical protein
MTFAAADALAPLLATRFEMLRISRYRPRQAVQALRCSNARTRELAYAPRQGHAKNYGSRDN